MMHHSDNLFSAINYIVHSSRTAYIKAAAVKLANESPAHTHTENHQSTEQVDSLQNELLVSDARNSQFFKLGVANPQQPLPTHPSALKHTNILLQAVVQT